MGKKTSPVEKCSYSYVCSYTQNILCISFFLSTSSKKKNRKGAFVLFENPPNNDAAWLFAEPVGF